MQTAIKHYTHKHEMMQKLYCKKIEKKCGIEVGNSMKGDMNITLKSHRKQSWIKHLQKCI